MWGEGYRRRLLSDRLFRSFGDGNRRRRCETWSLGFPAFGRTGALIFKDYGVGIREDESEGGSPRLG